ncbi:MAG TPA: hypothetical protein VGG56_01085 [Terracidiphilus sp.]
MVEELPPPQPARFSAAAAPALAPTPARNLRRETPLLMNVLKLATIFSPWMCLLYFRLAYQLLYDRMAALDLNEGKRFPLHGPSDLSVEDTQSSFDVMAVAWRDPRAGLLTRVHGLEQASAHSRRFVLCLVGVGERDTGARITGNGQLPKSAGGCLLKNKKTPLGYACLDETPDLQTGGARSRNHKKMASS